ncbi:Uu.00g084220.m01.CDS01 [Anthostomella pinea]|uniref:Uu.00g084220.m01.CDS01 n=1 Tax=Anthostomella pinea TaxID=933095 RepID=A0AAI8VLP1_9PEZI|nr:Uu.00g084220.m01.CDS01 [Anthostomella pinea]
MHFSNSILFAAAVGAGNVAGHAIHHRHSHLHKERAVGDIVTAVINGQTQTWANTWSGATAAAAVDEKVAEVTAAVAAASPTAAAEEKAYPTTAVAASASEPEATASSSSSSESSGSTVASSYKDFCAGKEKRATVAEIAYVGNTGACGWGSNIMLVADDIADQYDYTVKFTGENTEDWKVVCWNKIGPDGLPDGWYNGNVAVEFTLAPGAAQYIAIDHNSQGGCAAAVGTTIPKDNQGGYAATWFEFDVGNTSNKKWSGADVSSIQAQAAREDGLDLEIQGMKSCHSSICSTIGPNLSIVDNAFNLALKLADGLGLNIPDTKASIEVTIAYAG